MALMVVVGISSGPARLELPIYRLLREIGTFITGPDVFAQMAPERRIHSTNPANADPDSVGYHRACALQVGGSFAISASPTDCSGKLGANELKLLVQPLLAAQIVEPFGLLQFFSQFSQPASVIALCFSVEDRTRIPKVRTHFNRGIEVTLVTVAAGGANSFGPLGSGQMRKFDDAEFDAGMAE